MEEEWRTLRDFPNYVVSDQGNFANWKFGGRLIQKSQNQQGLPKIVLVNDGRPYTRSPAVLVAETFVPEERDGFDTVIHLDGDRTNCRADNLLWRPRWFTIKFHRQFSEENFHKDSMHCVDKDTGIHYQSLRDASMHMGIYYNDILDNVYNSRPVFPDWHTFEIVWEE